MTGKVKLDISTLLKESGATGIDLVRYGIAPQTAYRIAHGKSKGITFEVLEKLCDFFTERVGRPICPGDIVTYERS